MWVLRLEPGSSGRVLLTPEPSLQPHRTDISTFYSSSVTTVPWLSSAMLLSRGSCWFVCFSVVTALLGSILLTESRQTKGNKQERKMKKIASKTKFCKINPLSFFSLISSKILTLNFYKQVTVFDCRFSIFYFLLSQGNYLACLRCKGLWVLNYLILWWSVLSVFGLWFLLLVPFLESLLFNSGIYSLMW